VRVASAFFFMEDDHARLICQAIALFNFSNGVFKIFRWCDNILRRIEGYGT
jgi:hypothetical protein